MANELSFVHRFEPATRAASRPLLVLHGTGGDENDLVPLAQMIAPGAALLSPRGKVLENGTMLRFFKRLTAGVFDEEDVRARTHELADFVAAARKHYGIAAPVALGYSNGANIAAAMMVLRPEALAGAMLLRTTLPLSDVPKAGSLAGKPVLILSGANDTIIPAERATQLVSALQSAGATVERRTLPSGHELGQADIRLAHEWLQANEPALTASS
jgi:phospholipase/carboxylesterase